MGVSIYSSRSTGVCFIQGYFLPRWHCISIPTTVSSPLSFYLCLCVSPPLLSPLSSSSSHIRCHTGDAWLDGSPDQHRPSPWSAFELSLIDVCVAKPGPALLSKHWRSHHEKAKPCFPGRRFPTAWGHLPRVVKTGMLLQGCDDSGSYPVMHLRNVKLQIQTFLVQW